MTRRIATYERVSSDDQRERETILTQYDELQHRIVVEPDVEVIERFVDDGVSGTIDLKDRPSGRRLLREARLGRFDELWVYKLDRLGRDDVDPIIVRRELNALGVRVVSLKENLDDPFMYAMLTAMGAQERRTLLARSADGMARAARDGRYCGGIVPLGYTVEGKRPKAFLVPSDVPMWADKSEADVVRWIFCLVGVEGWSTRRVAVELNALGVQTSYQKDGRAVRRKATQGLWRAGRIRSLLVNPLYKGEYRYGRRSKEHREEIVSTIPFLVTEELWDATQAALASNRIIPTVSRNTYLLRGVTRCGGCGLSFCGAAGRAGTYWYRCNGQLVERGPIEGRCPSRAVKGPWLDEAIWTDIEAYLRDPGEVLADLAQEMDTPDESPAVSATDLHQRLAELGDEQARMVELAVKGFIDGDDLQRQKARIATARQELESRLDQLAAAPARVAPSLDADLLAAIRERLPELTIAEKQEIVRALVKGIVVHTLLNDAGKKELRIVVEYQFPQLQTADSGVALTDTGTGSSQPRAKSWPGM